MFLHFLNTLQPWFAALFTPTGALLFAEWAGAVLAITGSLAMSMNRSWSRRAWPIWILSNLLLIFPTAYARHWGLVATQVAFFIVNVNGWWRPGRRTPAIPSRQRRPRHRPRTSCCLTGGAARRGGFAAVGDGLTRTGRQSRLSRSPSPHYPPTPLIRSLDMPEKKPLPVTLTTTPTALDDDRRYYVYEFVDTCAPTVPLYIGKGTGPRLRDHAADARAYNEALSAGARPRAGRFVCKHAKALREGRRLVATKLKDGLTHQEALDQEAKLIAEIGRLEDGGPLYNISAGGEGVDPAITSSAPHRKRAAKQIRRVNTDPGQVEARSNRLRAFHADPAWHAAAVARIHPSKQTPETRARTLAAAEAGRRKLLADPVRRARLVAASSKAQHRRFGLPTERAKHALVMRKVHAAPGWREKVTATSRAAHQRPGWREAFERGMAKRDADGLHGARIREGLRRKRRDDPVFAAEASARGRAAMARLHADPRIRAMHQARLAALHRNPALDAWRRARQRWYFDSRRAVKAGLPPPPAPNREDTVPEAGQHVAPKPQPSSPTKGKIPMTTRTPLRRYSVTAAKRTGQRSLAQLLRFHKNRLNVTYRDIAAAAGVSVATLWEVVHSTQVRPTIDTVHRLAFVLGFSLAEVAPPL